MQTLGFWLTFWCQKFDFPAQKAVEKWTLIVEVWICSSGKRVLWETLLTNNRNVYQKVDFLVQKVVKKVDSHCESQDMGERQKSPLGDTFDQKSKRVCT